MYKMSRSQASLESYARHSFFWQGGKWLAAPKRLQREAVEATDCKAKARADRGAASRPGAATRACAAGSDFTTGRKPARRAGTRQPGSRSLELVFARGGGRGPIGGDCAQPLGQISCGLGWEHSTRLPRRGQATGKGWGGEVS